MNTIDIVMEAFSLYHNNNNSFKLTSKILQKKYNYKITRQTIMNWIKLYQLLYFFVLKTMGKISMILLFNKNKIINKLNNV